MNLHRPTVDVAIPCYNYGRYLRNAVEHALDQPGVDLRILIVDDCSTDHTRDVGEHLASQHPTVEFQHNSHNLGAVRTFNVAIDWAQGDYFVLISADDLLAPGALSRAARVLDSNPAVGLVYGDVIRFSDDDVPDLRGPAVEETVLLFSGREWLRRRCAAAVNNIASPEAMVRTSVQHDVGPYDDRLPHTHDMHNWLQVAARADVGRIRGPVHAAYRRHAHNLSTKQADSLASEYRHRLAAFEMFFASNPLPQADSRALEHLARQALADLALDAANRSLDGHEPLPNADALCDVALAADRAIVRHPSWWLQRLRRRLGPGRATWAPPFLLDRGIRWWRSHRALRRWSRDPD